MTRLKTKNTRNRNQNPQNKEHSKSKSPENSMALIVRDGDEHGEFDEEGEARDDFHIEQLVEDFVDEEPTRHDEYPESDIEDNEHVRERMRRHIRRGDGRLYYLQTFYSGVAFKEAVTDYVLRTGRNLKQYRHDNDKIGFKCVGDGEGEGRCKWQVYAAILPKDDMWKIRVYVEKHTCIPNGECEMFKVPVIARLFLDKIREEPDYYKPMKMEEIIKERWKISVSRPQCQAARNKALRWIEREYDLQFERIRDYAAEILEANKNSTVKIECTPNEEGRDIFSRFYVCFDVIRTTWKETCRPLIGVDGCFLKNKIKGQLLVAIGRDADNRIYPIAWGVVQVENIENWVWFVQNLKDDLGLGTGEGYILCSDRQKGLIKAVQMELQNVEHRMCVKHIYGNLKKSHGDKKRMKPLIWNLAWSYSEKEFKERLERLFCYDTGVYDSVMKTNPRSWCRAFYKIGTYCEDVDNNFTESFNSSINNAREKPFMGMLESIRRLAMTRIAKRSDTSHSHEGRCTPYVAKFLKAEHKKASACIVTRSTNSMFEVNLYGDYHRVCLEKMTCTCMKWQICGIPCEHPYGVIIKRKLEPDNYVVQWFRTAMWKKTYTHGLVPQRGPQSWPDTTGSNVYPPSEPPQPGRPKITKVTMADKKRKKPSHESPTKKKQLEKKRKVQCGVCGVSGHNSRFHKKKSTQASQGDAGEVTQVGSSSVIGFED